MTGRDLLLGAGQGRLTSEAPMKSIVHTKQGTSNPSRARSGFMLNTPITCAAKG